MNTAEPDRDGFTCPYCGYFEYAEVGFGVFHRCEGVIRAERERDIAAIRYASQQRKAQVERINRANFLMRSGILTWPEAYELANPLFDDDNDCSPF
jgi:hypothetical protein